MSRPGAVALAVLLAAACSPRAPEAWRRDLEAERAAKDRIFASAAGPLTELQRASFRSLRYFAPNPRFRLEAEFEAAASAETLGIVTSTGTLDRFTRAGTLRFALGERPCSLAVFQPLGNATWFVPFSDATSARTTYGAGRYLEVTPGTGPVTLDFNRAYNPYCAYNSQWVCPVPPPENHLDVAVEAGEKKFDDGH